MNNMKGRLTDKMSVERERLEEKEFFQFVPKRRTPVAQYLWRRGAQAYIISQLCGSVWQSFHCHQINQFTTPEQSKAAFDAISDKLKDMSAEKEAIWRNITYEVMGRLSTDTKTGEEEKDVVGRVVKFLAPIIEPSLLHDFEEKFSAIVRDASSLWAAVKTDKLRISMSAVPPSTASPEQSWLPGSLEGIESLPDVSLIIHAHSLCLFPAVKASPDNNAVGKNGDIHPGYALFSDSVAFALGNSEQQDYAREERELRYNLLRRNSATSQATTLVLQDLSPKSLTWDAAAVEAMQSKKVAEIRQAE
jgi:hypothetical protein